MNSCFKQVGKSRPVNNKNPVINSQTLYAAIYKNIMKFSKKGKA